MNPRRENHTGTNFKKNEKKCYRWTEEEDQRLAILVSKNGHTWKEFPSHFPVGDGGFRSSTSLKARYYSKFHGNTSSLIQRTLDLPKQKPQSIDLIKQKSEKEISISQSKKGDPWLSEFDAILVRAVIECGTKWSKIRSNAFPNRSEDSLKMRYYLITDDETRKKHQIARKQQHRPWTPDEDEMLYRPENGSFQGTTRKIAKCQSPWVSWTPADDELLLSLVSKHGTSWKSFQNSFPGRSPGGLKSRYYNHLYKQKAYGGINGFPWTPDEDAKLRDLTEKHGQDWELLAALFPKRTPFSLKNRYSSVKKNTTAGNLKGGTSSNSEVIESKISNSENEIESMIMSRKTKTKHPADMGAVKIKRVAYESSDEKLPGLGKKKKQRRYISLLTPNSSAARAEYISPG
mmetsp:Transcript_29182/g.36140  ORF Transcript_29182/g.36140 Transcript_29182/m.36140 type:complete len:403 (+) Transcript_29182:1104-2312(+)